MPALESASLCVLPWIHTHVQIDGTTKLCCVSRDVNRDAAGHPASIHRQSVIELFDSAFMQQVRSQMKAGNWPRACGTCLMNEHNGTPSFREFFNRKYAHYLEQIRSGTLTPAIRTIDVRISNLCNFKCRSCGPAFSSRWTEDQSVWGMQRDAIVAPQGIHNDEQFLKDLREEIIPHVEEIHFAGGEPLLMEEHYQILQWLIEAGRTDAELYYDTNLSRLGLKKADAVAIWQQFPNVRVSLSLDGTGPLGEYIRSGLDYAQWQRHVERVAAEAPHVRRDMHYVVSAYNILHLRQHYDEIMQAGYVTGTFGTTNLEWPRSLSIQVLHPALKAEARRRLQRMLEEDRLLRPEDRPYIEGTLNYLDSADLYPSHAAEFARYTRLLDSKRGENLLDLVPELALMLEPVAA